ncbi:MAG TPA: hypothetical protein VNL35_06105 [Chloroflexota bacterium]|nr:hypothetical protein [Chloroflexota bacterium]
MTVRRSRARRAGGTERLAEAFNPTTFSGGPLQEDWYWGRLSAGMEEDYYWRRLSDNWYQKDVIPSTYLEIHNQCYEAYNANPLANYIIEITTNFVLGTGISVAAANRKTQRVLDAFWNEPENHMGTRVYSLCTELSLYGELFIRFFVNPFSGAVKIAQIDPSLIDQIETDPDNIEKALRFHQRPVGPGGALWSATAPVGGIQPPAPTLEPTGASYPGDAVMAGTWYEAGSEVAQFKINSVSNAKRGKSDLATLLPWLRRYKDWLTDRVRINKYKAAFLWDIQLSGADAKTIDRKRMQYAYPPDPGSIIVHNESEQWSAVQPKIEAGDAEADGRAIKMMIAMGAGLPEHYLADGGDVNRATAVEMGLPTFRKFQRRQDTFGLVIRAILDRVLEEATRAGTLPVGVDRSYKVIFPELAPGDNSDLATATSTVTPALLSAHQAGWVSKETAMRLFYAMTGQEVNVAEELERIARERGSTG